MYEKVLAAAPNSAARTPRRGAPPYSATARSSRTDQSRHLHVRVLQMVRSKLSYAAAEKKEEERKKKL